jgi:hypothetical protein
MFIVSMPLSPRNTTLVYCRRSCCEMAFLNNAITNGLSGQRTLFSALNRVLDLQRQDTSCSVCQFNLQAWRRLVQIFLLSASHCFPQCAPIMMALEYYWTVQDLLEEKDFDEINITLPGGLIIDDLIFLLLSRFIASDSIVWECF